MNKSSTQLAAWVFRLSSPKFPVLLITQHLDSNTHLRKGFMVFLGQQTLTSVSANNMDPFPCKSASLIKPAGPCGKSLLVSPGL